jgi:hypothetical protein
MNGRIMQTSKIRKREDDYEVVFIRGDQELLKFFGEQDKLIQLSRIWEAESTENNVILEAVKMGVL